MSGYGEGVPAGFECEPARYRHWLLEVAGRVATLTLAVDEAGALMPGVALKRNSYDVGVDLELRDAVQRLRFEHPEVACVRLESALPEVFCAGANIGMLARASHGLKVNFCRLTNETRLEIEDACRAGQRFIAVLAGTASGGGYELALACERILLVDDRRAAVSLPELPLLAVLPGTGGLTRLTDKRGVRRDLADAFCTREEGVRAARALDWRLVDGIAPPSRFAELVARETEAALAAAPATKRGPPLTLDALAPRVSERELVYRHVHVALAHERRLAEITLHAVRDLSGALRLARELDDALLRLRFQHPGLGLWLLRSRGDFADVRALDAALAGDGWLASEVRALLGRTLKRLENSARSCFALADASSCFSGTLLEFALAADRLYLHADDGALELGAPNRGFYPMGNGLTRLETRFYGDASALALARAASGVLSADAASALGLATEAPDAIEWDDAIRLACEERASFSPDALTGLEQNLRFAGPETLETKIFARLSAWQNWIFQRPNASGPDGALRAYGRPERAKLNLERT